MWYDHLGIISMGAQCNAPECHGLGDIKIDLWRSLCESCHSTYCNDVDHYALALRIGGIFADYDEEKTSKIRHSKKGRFIGADIDIPMAVLLIKTTNELKFYLSNRVLDAMSQLVDRLKKEKLNIDGISLLKDVREAISVFNNKLYENMA